MRGLVHIQNQHKEVLKHVGYIREKLYQKEVEHILHLHIKDKLYLRVEHIQHHQEHIVRLLPQLLPHEVIVLLRQEHRHLLRQEVHQVAILVEEVVLQAVQEEVVVDNNPLFYTKRI
jgi:hypothetical protein